MCPSMCLSMCLCVYMCLHMHVHVHVYVSVSVSVYVYVCDGGQTRANCRNLVVHGFALQVRENYPPKHVCDVYSFGSEVEVDGGNVLQHNGSKNLTSLRLGTHRSGRHS